MSRRIRKTRPRWPRWGIALLQVAFLLFGTSNRCSAYSVLTHEAIIDLAWNDSIRPLLLSRYPGTRENELAIAHAYAYGGCAIQDAGYYPFGNQFFSNLTHYVRTGDFIASLFRNARNVNEYAFAIGAMSHYIGDSIGHADAINPATALEFPSLARKYGSTVTYDEAPHAFVATEFSFDVDEISQDRFAPDAYLRYIGLRVPRELLARAFFETYGLKLTAVLGKTTRAAIRGYRGSIRSFIPVFAKAEVVLHRSDFPQTDGSQAFDVLQQRLKRAPYQPAWAHAYRAPRFGEHVLAAVIRILPPVGPVAYLKIRGPHQETEQLYIRSLNRTLDLYNDKLGRLRLLPAMPLSLPNRDLDTGDWTKPGEYTLSDQTYARLLHSVVSNPAGLVPAGLQRDILNYYADPDAPFTTKRNHRQWEQVEDDLVKLKQMKQAQPEDIAANL